MCAQAGLRTAADRLRPSLEFVATVGSAVYTILVVDDEPAIRLLCRVNLELEGYRVLEAGSLDEARRQLDAESVDGVLLDVHVGLDEGYELLRELTERDPAIPAALVTGSADVDTVDSANAAAVLGKPFTLEQLSDTVRLLVSLSGADVDSHIA
jgi:DNA-binding NtrC family response regulator